jgi:hypothetical protein
MRKSAKFWHLLVVGALTSLTAGCSTVGQTDQRVAISRANSEVASLGPQTPQHTSGYYASHCDEQTRQMQHELANCTAVPLVIIPLEPPSPS